MIGIACMLGFGIATAYAQTATPCSTPANCPRENCAPANCPQTQCAKENCTTIPCDRKYCDRPGQCPEFSCFNGLTLTDTQKQQLQSLCKQYGDKRQALRQNGREYKQHNDSLKKDLRNKALDLKRQQLADIKKILTPEQYTQFLEQNYLNGNRKHAANGNFKHHKSAKKEICKDSKKACKKAAKSKGN